NLYQKPSTQYPTPLPHHNPRFNPDPEAKGEFKVPLSRLTETQLGYFLGIEYPEAPGAPPQGNNWNTIGQFYDYIRDRIEAETTDADFRDTRFQLDPRKGYYSPNNVDTLYPRHASYNEKPTDWSDPSAKGAKAAVSPDARDSGGLVRVHDKASALRAIETICRQGE